MQNNNNEQLQQDNNYNNNNENDNKNKKNKFKAILARILAFITTFIIYYINTKYSIFSNCYNYIINNPDIVNKVSLSIMYVFTIISILYNVLGLFILSIKSNIDIDLNKIKIKFIQNYLKNLLAANRCKVNNSDIEALKKHFTRFLNFTILMVIIYIICLFILI